MNEKIKIYTAGPDVFRQNAAEHLESMRKLGEQYGFEILTPFDTKINPELDRKEVPLVIGRGNFETIENADIIVANLMPFRGVCVDDGTCVEIGYGFAKGKVICGYNGGITTLKAKTYEYMFDNASASSMDFPVIEDFDLQYNLMIHDAIVFSNGVTMATFEDVLKVLAERYKDVLKK